jgi:ATP-dependent RNA helicase RhlE
MAPSIGTVFIALCIAKPYISANFRQDIMQDSQFASLGLNDFLMRAIQDAGYTTPTPIQAQAIPILMRGQDLLGCAQTGTGKTAAFTLPILQRLSSQKRHMERRQVRVLILTPTRELAVQIHESFQTYGKYLRLKTATVFGGVSQNVQVRALSGGLDVLVATPGRLLDLIRQKHVNLGQLEVFVLDEADRMLDMGFIHDIRTIIELLPKQRHTMLFSATMPNEIRTLSGSLLRDPARVDVAPKQTTAEKISQWAMFVERDNKRRLLQHVLKQAGVDKAIIFTRTKHGANRISDMLTDCGVRSEAIHGNKAQGARQRALQAFREGRVRALVATDVMARGIDIDDVTHVINFDVPSDSESYVHRIGRTGRAGASGHAITFCDAEERGFLKDIEKLVGYPIPPALDQPFHSEAAMNSKNNSKSLRHGFGKSAYGKGKSKGGGFKGPGKRRGHGSNRPKTSLKNRASFQ